jgi:hypothetical protein
MDHKSRHGVKDLIPKRKEPFTRDILLNTILGAPDATAVGRFKIVWASRSGRVLPRSSAPRSAAKEICRQMGMSFDLQPSPPRLRSLMRRLARLHRASTAPGVSNPNMAPSPFAHLAQAELDLRLVQNGSLAVAGPVCLARVTSAAARTSRGRLPVCLVSDQRDTH